MNIFFFISIGCSIIYNVPVFFENLFKVYRIQFGDYHLNYYVDLVISFLIISPLVIVVLLADIIMITLLSYLIQINKWFESWFNIVRPKHFSSVVHFTKTHTWPGFHESIMNLAKSFGHEESNCPVANDLILIYLITVVFCFVVKVLMSVRIYSMKH